MRKLKITREEARERKLELYEQIKAGRITIGQATREMRKIVGMNQKDYAEKVLGIFPRVLLDIENDRGNPTLETLQKIAEPFGLKVGFIRPTPMTFNVSVNESLSASDQASATIVKNHGPNSVGKLRRLS
jgi:DNA-binding XRE family transcriptional regulator